MLLEILTCTKAIFSYRKLKVCSFPAELFIARSKRVAVVHTDLAIISALSLVISLAASASILSLPLSSVFGHLQSHRLLARVWSVKAFNLIRMYAKCGNKMRADFINLGQEKPAETTQGKKLCRGSIHSRKYGTKQSIFWPSSHCYYKWLWWVTHGYTWTLLSWPSPHTPGHSSYIHNKNYN